MHACGHFEGAEHGGETGGVEFVRHIGDQFLARVDGLVVQFERGRHGSDTEKKKRMPESSGILGRAPGRVSWL